jgi:hypothetical protein
MELAGGAGFYRAAGLERRFRDMQGARYHPLQRGPQAHYTPARWRSASRSTTDVLRLAREVSTPRVTRRSRSIRGRPGLAKL